MPRKPEYVSIAAAARTLRRSPSTVRRYFHERVLAGRQLCEGGWIEIDREDLRRLTKSASNIR